MALRQIVPPKGYKTPPHYDGVWTGKCSECKAEYEITMPQDAGLVTVPDNYDKLRMDCPYCKENKKSWTGVIFFEPKTVAWKRKYGFWVFFFFWCLVGGCIGIQLAEMIVQ